MADDFDIDTIFDIENTIHLCTRTLMEPDSLDQSVSSPTPGCLVSLVCLQAMVV